MKGWQISLEQLAPGFDRRQLYPPCDFLFECPHADLASLVYSVNEVRMGWLVGSFAILQQKAHPSVVLSSSTFRCFCTQDTVSYSENGQLVFVKTYWQLLSSEQHSVLALDLPFTIFDVASQRFACVVLKDSLPYQVREVGERLFRLVSKSSGEPMTPHEEVLIVTEKLTWHHFSDIDHFHELYRMQRGS